MTRYILLILLILTTSCFLMPPGAPHYHSYKAIDDDFTVEVFCTPRDKVYHFFYDNHVEIEGCSQIFIEETCASFKLDDFFGEEKFQKAIKINDRNFHKLFKVDTLQLSIAHSKEIIKLLPIK